MLLGLSVRGFRSSLEVVPEMLASISAPMRL